MSVQAQADLRFSDSRIFHRVFTIFAFLAVASLVISLGGRQIGARLSMGGHTDDTSMHEVVIGNDVIAMRSNFIRYAEQRRDGVTNRLDLYASWPSLSGFTEVDRPLFNNQANEKRLLFITLERRTLSRDMAGRLEPIYSKLFEGAETAGPAGLTRHALSPSAGYVDEFLYVSPADSDHRFVARCLDDAKSGESMAPCETDVHVGDDLVMMVRFPSALLADWASLDRKLAAFAAEAVRTAPAQQ